MKICVCVGHSRLKNGAYTSADGVRYGGCNEYKYNKKLAKQVVKKLRKKGHTVKKVICPEKKFLTSAEEKNYKLNIVNSGDYDLCIELHLNASDNMASGCEVLYVSQKGMLFAQNIQNRLSKIFKDRGAKKRDNLYMLTKTTCPSIIVESFFCTNRLDYLKGKGLEGRKKIAKAIANGIG